MTYRVAYRIQWISEGGIELTIRKERFGDVLDVTLQGRLDAASSQLLETEMEQSYNGLHELNIDIRGLEYISSAGLRVLLSAQRRMNRQGVMTLSRTTEQVQNVLDATGFSDMMLIC